MFASFKELCLSYQRGEWDAETFYDSSCGLLGDAGPVLRVVSLMPDPVKRAEVFKCHAASCAVSLPTTTTNNTNTAARHSPVADDATTKMSRTGASDRNGQDQRQPQQHDALPQRERRGRRA